MRYNFKYFENKDKDNNVTAVTCIAIPAELDLKLNKLSRMIAFYFDLEGINNGSNIIVNSKRIPNPYKEYIGVARLKPNDKNDLKIAYKVARKKALRRAISSFNQAYKTINHQLNCIKGELWDTIISNDHKISKITSEIIYI